MAAVFVVATLPPFSRPGYKMDITVSSAGDARSLEGGILLMTPLYGPDGQIYAQAQGSLVLGGYMATAGGNTRLSNHPTTARIPGGALVERAVPFELKQMHVVSVILNDADFHTAERMAASIDKALGAKRAHAVDSRRIDVAAAPDEDMAALLDRVEQVEVDVFPRARVVVNERTGTVVIGGKVRLQPVSILHGGLSVNVISETEVSQPNPLSGGTTQVIQQTTVQATDKPVNRIDLKEGATVEDLVQELQRTGAGARDVISILQASRHPAKYGLEFEDIDIIGNRENYAEMVRKSGQPLSLRGDRRGDARRISGEEVENYLLSNDLVRPTGTSAGAPTNAGCSDAEEYAKMATKTVRFF